MPTLHVCITCRASQPLVENEPVRGQRLFDAVAAAAPQEVVVRAVKCLSVCDSGCAATISAPGKWTYLLGRLEPELVPDLLSYAATYAAHPTGTVLPSRRPASLARVILGRVPHLDAPDHGAPAP